MSVRTIQIQGDVMARNDAYAGRVRRRLLETGVAAFNLISSPGSGKTTLLERTLERLDREIPIAVVTGDVQTENDARRLERHTARLVQAVVTDGGCHLDARQIHDAVGALDLSEIRLLFVENVGNLVCPATWDLGEAAKIVVLSVTEGEDKPLKYPTAFRRARMAVFNKVDLLPHLEYDLDAAVRYARQVNPEIETLFVSAKTGQGMDGWYDFLRDRLAGREAA
ncbi:MAG TPA: hydrogenase nickel incorporation protein HypB [Gemmatimonadota bacterium]|nr:hydrogenase nickel incorporation protein HypB [Gemmatimonadota bacterium]